MIKTYRVRNLDCANCAAKVERALGKLDGVNSASVSFLTQKITLDVEDGREIDIAADVKRVCKKVEPDMELVLK